MNASAPLRTKGSRRLASRPITRTFSPLASNFSATTLPVFPVAPVITYMAFLLMNFNGGQAENRLSEELDLAETETGSRPLRLVPLVLPENSEQSPPRSPCSLGLPLSEDK